MLLDYGFSNEQLVSIYNLLKMIKETNTNIASNSKIDGIQYYMDKHKNFYASYCLSDYSEGGAQTQLVYTSINPFGEVINLNSIYVNQSDIVVKLEKCQKISLA